MRKSAFIVPAAALIAGVAGRFLRRAELREAFEEVSGLPVRGAPETTRLIVLTVIVLALCAAFSFMVSRRYKSPKGYSGAFAPAGGAHISGSSIFGVIWLAATVKYALDIRTAGAYPTVELYFTVFSALSAISLPLFAIAVYKKPSGGGGMLLSIVPTLFMCFWLVLFYRQNAANPVLLSYCYQCLALISAALSFYFVSSYAFGKPAPGAALFSFLAAIYFCCVTYADDIPLELRTILAAAAVYALANAISLLRNLEQKNPPEELPEDSGEPARSD